MATTNLITLVRDEFRAAFAAYTEEGRKMRQLLLELESAPNDALLEAIRVEQTELNHAKERYEQAQTRYVREVFGALAANGATLLP
jgi:hypothetical protein